jgi:hypothetical protein
MRRVLATIACAILLTGCRYSFFDDFEAGTLGSGYRWFDEGRPDRWEISGGWLRITASTGQDLWGGQSPKRGAPLMLRQAPTGDYEVSSIVDARWGGTPQRVNTQVGLFVFQDVQNWLFFGFTYHLSQGGELPDGDGLIVTSVLGGVSKIEHYENWAGDVAALTIVKSGDAWYFHGPCLSDPSPGCRQQIARVNASFARYEVGMGVKSFQTGGTAQQGNFDYFEIQGR